MDKLTILTLTLNNVTKSYLLGDADLIGDLSQLQTESKSTIVEAINELYELIGNGGAAPSRHSITYNLTHCLSNNTNTYIYDGESFDTRITPVPGYVLSTVTVTVGGTPVPVQDNYVNITDVKGDIVVNALAILLGEVTEASEISLNGDALAKGRYTLKYEDAEGNVIDPYANITTLTVN